MLDERVAASTVEGRVGRTQDRRRRGQRLVWQQADAAGLTDPVERAELLLRRRHPEMPDQWFRDVARLASLHAAGAWHGFERP
jgi:hypothetical protein